MAGLCMVTNLQFPVVLHLVFVVQVYLSDV